MKSMKRWGLLGMMIGAACLWLQGCDGDAAPADTPPPACEGIACNPAVPLADLPAQYVVIESSSGVTVGGLTSAAPIGDGAGSQKNAPRKLSLSVPPPVPGTNGAKSAVTSVDIPFAAHAGGSGTVVALTRSGEILIDDSESTIDCYNRQAAKLLLWNPQQDIATAVPVLQHRKNSASEYLYDPIGDQILFVEQVAEGNKAALKRRSLADGTEEVIFSAQAINFLARTVNNEIPVTGVSHSSAASPFSTCPQPTPGAYVRGGAVLLWVDDGKTVQVVSVNVSTKTVAKIDVGASLPAGESPLGSSAGSSGGSAGATYETMRTIGNGTVIVDLRLKGAGSAETIRQVHRPDLLQHWDLLQPPAGQTETVESVYPLGNSEQELVVRVRRVSSDPTVPAADFYHLYSLEQSKVLVTIPQIPPSLSAAVTPAALVAGLKTQTLIGAVLAKYGDGHLVELVDQLCTPGKNASGISCEAFDVQLGLFHADGKIDRIGQPVSDQSATLRLVDAASQRALIASDNADGHDTLSVLNLADGSIVSSLAQALVLPVYAPDAVGRHWNHLSAQFLKQTSEGTTISLVRAPDLAAITTDVPLAPATLATVQGSPQIFVIDRGAAREKPAVADATVAPKSKDPCAGFCGNGTVEENVVIDGTNFSCSLAEECDDGNTTDGDGCSGTCVVEALAAPVCGDGKVDAPEACDGGDGCNGDCTLQPPPVVDGSPPTPPPAAAVSISIKPKNFHKALLLGKSFHQSTLLITPEGETPILRILPAEAVTSVKFSCRLPKGFEPPQQMKAIKSKEIQDAYQLMLTISDADKNDLAKAKGVQVPCTVVVNKGQPTEEAKEYEVEIQPYADE